MAGVQIPAHPLTTCLTSPEKCKQGYFCKKKKKCFESHMARSQPCPGPRQVTHSESWFPFLPL